MKKVPKATSLPLNGYTLDQSVMKDTIGRYRTLSLFEGKCRAEDTPIFSLEDYHKTNLPSFKRLYVEIFDPSEYEVATKLLGSWEHWLRLMECQWFKPYLSECREELNAKVKSIAVNRIIEDSKSAFSEATRLAANKFLATGGYMVEAEKEVAKEVAKRGRPSKEEVERRTKEILTEEGRVAADFERLMGNSETVQ